MSLLARYVLGRLLSAVVSIWFIVTVTFFLMHAIPGGPFSRDKDLPEQILRNIEKKYHLDRPLWEQYVRYMVDLARFDLGPSFKYEALTVNDIIREGFPVSASLGGFALFLALCVGIPLGVVSATNHNRWQDTCAMGLATALISVPAFVLGPFLIYVFSVKLGLFPPARWGTPEQAVLPTVALAGFPMAFIARLTRSGILECLNRDYILMARAKGLSEFTVIYRHALRNALIPIVTFLGPCIAEIFTGSFVIEYIFGIPGLGRHFVMSIYNRDYTVILGTTVFYSVLLVTMNLLVDILYGLLDPRVSLNSRGERS